MSPEPPMTCASITAALVAWSSCVTLSCSFSAASCSLSPEAVGRDLRSSNAVRERRPASSTIHTCWLRSVVNCRVISLARRAVAVHEMFRNSSPRW